MAKDPAFLFYSKDFYEGTRTMIPEERACYIDLLIYQHQHGIIPNDLKRVLMYCSGIEQATLQATLEAKFKQTDKGWVNKKLNDVVFERAEFKNKLSINGTIGQFWKKCKANLNAKDYKKLRKDLENIDKTELFEFLKDKTINESTLKALLKALLKHYANVDADVNVNADTDKSGKGGTGEKPELIYPFTTDEFLQQWELWKDYKKKEHSFKYKTLQSEQASLKELSNLSKGVVGNAIKILHQSMANGWKGFFELKNNTNGNRNQNQHRTDAEAKRDISNKVDNIYDGKRSTGTDNY